MLHRWRHYPRTVPGARLLGSTAPTTPGVARIRDTSGSPFHGDPFHPAVTRQLKRLQLDLLNRATWLPPPLYRVVKQAAYMRRIFDGGKFVTPQATVRRHIIAEKLSRPDLVDAVCKLDVCNVHGLRACAVSLALLLPRPDALLGLDALFARSILHASSSSSSSSTAPSSSSSSSSSSSPPSSSVPSESAVSTESQPTAVAATLPFSFEVPLLCSFTLLQACAERGIDAKHLVTPALVLSLMAERARSSSGGSADKLLPVPGGASSQQSLTTHCMDQLAMSMCTLAAVSSAARASRSTADTPRQAASRAPSPLSTADSKTLLELLTDRCERTLVAASSLGHVVEMASLRVVWETAAGLQLPNAYSMYKAMYEAVLVGLQAAPLQLTEEAVTTLLESMYTSRFKHSRLIHALGEPIRQHGVRFDRCGARLFSALVSLESMPLALELLDGMMKTVSESASNVNGHRALSKVGSSFLSLSAEGLMRIEDYLESTGGGGYTVSGLILALHCFSREDRGTRYYQLLESMEIEMLAKIPSLPRRDVVSLFHAYGSVTRLQPQACALIVERIEAELETMNKMDLRTVLWAHARLDLRSAYIPRAAAAFFRQLSSSSGINSLSSLGYSQVTVALWSLACLQALSFQHYLQVEPLLLSAHRRSGRPSPALFQVLAELRFGNLNSSSPLPPALAAGAATATAAPTAAPVALPRPTISLDTAVSSALTGSLPSSLHVDFPLPSSSESSSSSTAPFTSVWALRPWEQTRGEQRGTFVSSKTHLKISSILDHMAVPHSNETQIGYGYIVDIFIPGSVEGGANGTVMEIDGPFHFESFQHRPIGPTMMKRRHLAALGFKVVSIPYTSWNKIHADPDKMRAMLRRSLGNS